MVTHLKRSSEHSYSQFFSFSGKKKKKQTWFLHLFLTWYGCWAFSLPSLCPLAAQWEWGLWNPSPTFQLPHECGISTASLDLENMHSLMQPGHTKAHGFELWRNWSCLQGRLSLTLSVTVHFWRILNHTENVMKVLNPLPWNKGI